MSILKKEDLKKILYKSLVERKTYKQIALEMNITPDNVYCYIANFKKEQGITRTLWKLDWYSFNGQKQEIINKYLKGISTVKLGVEYGVSDHTMAVWLSEQGIPIRNVGKISKINQIIFNEIDSEIKAYTLGLITSDGNVSEKGNTITITLTKSDKYILEQINDELLNGLGNIFISHPEDKEQARVVLQFNGKAIKQALSKFGIIPNKSYYLNKLSDNIPKELYHHYIRGLFDGDGVCSYETTHKKERVVRVGYCAYRKDFTESYRNFLVDELQINSNKLFNTGNCWQCSWAKKSDVKKFYDYIYNDANIFLGRKYKKISDYVNTEVN